LFPTSTVVFFSSRAKANSFYVFVLRHYRKEKFESVKITKIRTIKKTSYLTGRNLRNDSNNI